MLSHNLFKAHKKQHNILRKFKQLLAISYLLAPPEAATGRVV